VFDTSADVYALGVLVWALIHGGHLPKDLSRIPPTPDRWTATSGGFTALPMDAELARLLNACLSTDPLKRPRAEDVSRRAASVLMKDTHRALFIGAETPFELDKSNPQVTLEYPSIGSLTVEYDGLDFRAAAISGEVCVNNMQPTPGARLPECCVIALGGHNRRMNNRLFITMDVSHPEVVL
jgi:serine/threonine-protein kinase